MDTFTFSSVTLNIWFSMRRTMVL
uniref:Uncharacterized protein n=1 Tax=Rhizophora mucronata TaxID=61149 RepID=A0A2P2P0Y3_RHIMU